MLGLDNEKEDIRHSILSDVFMGPAIENFAKLSKEQTLLWQCFCDSSNTINILQKSDIIPSQIARYLPNIWIVDLIHGNDGALMIFRSV